MISNGGRQLDGGRSPFDQLEEIMQASGEIEIILMEVFAGHACAKGNGAGRNHCSGGRSFYALAGARLA